MTPAIPKRFKIPAEWYYRLLEMSGQDWLRVELIDGEVLEMPPQKNWHALGITLTAEALEAAFGPGFWVRQQCSLDLTPYSVPDPDVAVVEGAPRQWRGPKDPTTALLIVEVSDTTLAYDRGRKASLYAASGIADYWILNLVDSQLEVYRRPIADTEQEFGHRYADISILRSGEHIAPIALPDSRVAVADLLP